MDYGSVGVNWNKDPKCSVWNVSLLKKKNHYNPIGSCFEAASYSLFFFSTFSHIGFSIQRSMRYAWAQVHSPDRAAPALCTICAATIFQVSTCIFFGGHMSFLRGHSPLVTSAIGFKARVDIASTLSCLRAIPQNLSTCIVFPTPPSVISPPPPRSCYRIIIQDYDFTGFLQEFSGFITESYKNLVIPLKSYKSPVKYLERFFWHGGFPEMLYRPIAQPPNVKIQQTPQIDIPMWFLLYCLWNIWWRGNFFESFLDSVNVDTLIHW